MLRKTLAVVLLTGAVGMALAQTSNSVWVDRLHGFKVRLPEGWGVSIIGGLPVFRKDHNFIVVGATPYEQSLKEVAQKFIRTLRTIQLEQPRLAYRTIPQGIQVVGEGLGYPYALNPHVIMGLTPAPTRFSLVGLVLKGQKLALTVWFIFPEDVPASIRKEMGELIRSLEFLPANQRVKWRVHTLHDPLLGMPIATLHVPEGYTVEGGPFRQEAMYLYRYEVKHTEFVLRMDAVKLVTYVVTSMGTTNGSSVLMYNGASGPMAAPIVLRTPEEVEALLLALWQKETGNEWRVVHRRTTPQPDLPSSAPSLPGSVADNKRWQLSLTAESGDKMRSVQGMLQIATTQQPDPVAASLLNQVYLYLVLMEAPKAKREWYESIAAGIASSVQVDVGWSLAAFEQFTRTTKEINKQVQEMVGRMREDNSRMARTWANALSDQTYIRDPESGEVFKVYKRVWDTDQFWREPVFGTIIGTIGKETKLGELLREAGWKVMDESLAGFP